MMDSTEALTSQLEPPAADPTAPASSPVSAPTMPAIGSNRLGPPLRGVDLETWTPGDVDEASAAIGAVADYCRDYCPVRLSCVEERCRLYRLEQRAAEVLGYKSNPVTESVGVQGQSIIGI